MRTFAENNFQQLADLLEGEAKQQILRLLDDVTNGPRTRAALGKRCVAVALATIDVIVYDSSPKTVTVQWPVLMGEENQLIFTPMTDTHLWVASLMRIPSFSREVDMEELRAAAKQDIIAAVKNVDPDNLLTSVFALAPVAKKMQGGLKVRLSVVELTPIGEVSASMMQYLKQRFFTRLDTQLTIVGVDSIMDGEVIAELGPIIQKFTAGKGTDKSSDASANIPAGMQIIRGILG